MTREAFRELVKKDPVLLDGATGTNLQRQECRSEYVRSSGSWKIQKC